MDTEKVDLLKDKEMPMQDIADFSRRLKILEERYTNLKSRLQLIDQNMLLNNKKTTTDFKIINSDISELKNKVNDINEIINLIIKELKNTSSKEDVEVLQKYINLWEPVNFVTRKEVEKLINDIKSEKK